MTVDQLKSSTYRNQINTGNTSDKIADKSVEESFQKAMGTYTSFVKDRIKNGEPKFQIGGSEMSEKEWNNLIKKVDTSIDTIKEELAKRIEVLKEKAEKERDYKKRKEHKKIIEDDEKDKDEQELLEKTMAELNRISLLQKASLERTAVSKEKSVEDKEDMETNTLLYAHDKIEATEEQIRKLLEDR